MHRVERQSKLTGYMSVCENLHALGPLGRRLCPGGQKILSALLAHFIDKQTAKVRLLGMDHWKSGWTVRRERFAGGVKQVGIDAFPIDAKGLGLGSDETGKKLERDSAALHHAWNRRRLLEVIHARSELEITP